MKMDISRSALGVAPTILLFIILTLPLYAADPVLTLGEEINVGKTLTVAPLNQYQSDLRVNPLQAKQMMVTSKNGREENTLAFTTDDGGKNWSVVRQDRSGDPDNIYGNNGWAHWGFIDKNNGGKISYRRSKTADSNWEPAKLITGDRVDHPHFAVDRTGGRFAGTIYFAGQIIGQTRIAVMRSRDGGDTWEQGNADTPVLRAGFVNGPPVVMEDGTLVIFAKSANSIITDPDGTYGGANAKLYVIRSSDGGVTFTEPVFVCDKTNPKTPGPGHSRPFAGGLSKVAGVERLYVVKLTPKPSPHPAALQITTSDDRGATWSALRDIAPSTPAGWGAGPMSLMANKQGVLGVQYFSVSSSGQYDVYFVASTDGGETFCEPIRVSSATSSPPSNESQSRELGGDQIFADVAGDGTFHLVWTDNRDGDNTYSIYTRSVTVNGL